MWYTPSYKYVLTTSHEQPSYVYVVCSSPFGSFLTVLYSYSYNMGTVRSWGLWPTYASQPATVGLRPRPNAARASTAEGASGLLLAL